jgi:RNA polymerase primary sigma factor
MREQTADSVLGWYLDKIKSTPLLTAEEERQLSRRVREHSDAAAREQMVAANLRLVVRIAKEYSNPGMTLSDLVAEGNLGLMRAVEEFDPDTGVRFSTYAAWWIKQAIKRAMINAGQPIHIPAYLAKLIGKWRRAGRQFEIDHGRPPTVEELGKQMRLSAKQLELLQQGLAAVGASSQVGIDDTQAICEILPDDESANPETALLAASDRPYLQSLMKRLPPRQRRILELRYGLDGHEGPQRTYKQIGRIIGLTRERVRQLEKQALGELRRISEEV